MASSALFTLPRYNLLSFVKPINPPALVYLFRFSIFPLRITIPDTSAPVPNPFSSIKPPPLMATNALFSFAISTKYCPLVPISLLVTTLTLDGL